MNLLKTQVLILTTGLVFLISACGEDTQKELGEAADQTGDAAGAVVRDVSEATSNCLNDFGEDLEDGFNEFVAKSEMSLDRYSNRTDELSEDKRADAQNLIDDLDREMTELEVEFKDYQDASDDEQDQASQDFQESYQSFNDGMANLADLFGE